MHGHLNVIFIRPNASESKLCLSVLLRVCNVVKTIIKVPLISINFKNGNRIQNLVILVTGQVYLHVVNTPVQGSDDCM
jgi:hypothetical protein